ncbi:hypothetical protein GCM10009790_26060 [Georgenia ruanii]
MLGPVEARLDSAVDLGPRKQRALLAALTLHLGRPVPVHTLVDLLWGDRPPARAVGALQVYVAGLRRRLEPARPARAPAGVLVTVEPGYALRLRADEVDAAIFDRDVAAVHQALAPLAPLGQGRAPAAAPDAATLAEAAQRLAAAMALWRGTPYLELQDAEPARAERARLEELRLLAVEDLALARLVLGQEGAVAAELEALTGVHPWRERLWALRAVALTRTGRQAEALAVLRRVRDVLRGELGLEPGPELRALTTGILRQDPALEWSISRQTPDLARSGSPLGAPAPRSGAGAGTGTGTGTTLCCAPAAPGPRLPPWPLVGRDAELAALAGLLDAAAAGNPGACAITGEQGIGKSRLCAELAARARAREVRLLAGRCSGDGAPPLWPWATALLGLGEDRPLHVGEKEPGAAFRAWEAIAAAVLRAAANETVLLVLDDLDVADASSLRVLRLLADMLEGGRLLVVVTWHEPRAAVPALDEAVDALAHRDVLRLPLAGVTAADATTLVSAVAGISPTPAQAAALHDRTAGNPLFLVEYARLARERRDLTALLTEPGPPGAVRDVLLRRLHRLPAATVQALHAAAVVGRRFDLAATSAAVGASEDELLDHLDPALAGGLVRDVDIDQFAFTHALVRDTICTILPASRRARLHARVAGHLSTLPGRETEAAHHWLASGPAHAARAWRAAVAGAAVAGRYHAHDQAATLLRAALTAQEADRGATARDRHAVLLDLAEACRWAGDWPGLTDAAAGAVAVADEIGDLELLARAATAPTAGTLWQSASPGQVHGDTVATLRRVLRALPAQDGRLRCEAMLSLANELYYVAGVAERRRLTEGAVAMARRLGDDPLLLDAYEIACLSLWCPATRRECLDHSGRAVELATRLGDERSLVIATTLRAVSEGELGLVAPMWATAARAREHAARLRLPYALLVLDNLELAWLTLAGRFAEAEQRLADMEARRRATSRPLAASMVARARGTLRLWQGRGAEALPPLLGLEGGFVPVTSFVLVLMLRAGQEEAARAHLSAHPVDLEHECWFSMLDWCLAGEAALRLGDAALGAAAAAKLARHTGQSSSAGSGNAAGPADMYLAMAEAAAGRLPAATAHADRAEELCTAWGIPLAAQLLREQRTRHGF